MIGNLEIHIYLMIFDIVSTENKDLVYNWEFGNTFLPHE